MDPILIAGGGPAGAAAALAARLDGAAVLLVERTATPRHKVCGEFLSPGAGQVLEALGVLPDFTALGPHRIERWVLHLGRFEKRWTLDEPAWGLSRLALDRLLLARAAAAGAEVRRGEACSATPLILAYGRHPMAHHPDQAPRAHPDERRGQPNLDQPSTLTPERQTTSRGPDRAPRAPADERRGQPNLDQPPTLTPEHQATSRGPDRLFGFKSHFEGPSDDAVELFFDAAGYAGVSGIEGGLTNVCGIAPESLLRRYGFDFDAVVRRSVPLARRLEPLRRSMSWIVTGPLSFSGPPQPASTGGQYPAGDALGFVDPFTGSGILNALVSGRLAGIAAARGIPPADYVAACRRLMARPYYLASLLRRAAALRGVWWLAPYIPARAIFNVTRLKQPAPLFPRL